jgi:hypothetical protein
MRVSDDEQEEMASQPPATGAACGLPRINRKLREAAGVDEDEQREIDVLENENGES